MPGENNDVKVDSRRPPQLKMIELDHLTEQEQQVIIDVLQRDEILRKNEESRIRKLRLELQDLRKQGTIREGDDKKNLCARCREPLGMFASTEVCPKCQHTVCKECQVFTPSRKRWVCKVCHKSMQIKIESGEWFYEKLEVDNVRLFGSDLVKASLDRVHNRSKANSFDEQDESSRQNYQGKQNHYAGTPRSTPHGTPRSTPRATPRGTPRGMSPHGSPQRRRGNRSQDSVSVTSSEGNRTRGQQNEVDRSESASSIQSRGMAETDASKPPNGYEVEGDKSKQRRSRLKKMFPSFKSLDRKVKSKSDDKSATQESLEKVKTEVDVAVEVTEAPDQTQVSGEQEAIVIPDVSVQEVQESGETEPSTAPVVLGGLVASEKFGQDEEQVLENIEDETVILTTTTSTDIDVVVVSENETVQSEIPAEITAEIPPQLAAEQPELGTEEKLFKKQTSSSEVPKRYSKDLEKGSSTSLTSLYSAGGEAYGKIPITGDVQFGLSYNHKLIQFSINVVSCQDLAPVDTKKNKSDPYVKIYLLPDKGRNGKRKTKTKKGTINPQFNEVLRYKIKETELRTRTLSVAVWNHDKLGRNFFLGEVLLPLDDIQFDNYNPKWHQLLPKVMLEEGGIIYKGDITLAIKFEGEGAEADQKQAKSKGSLLVHFKSAKNLTAVRLNGSDPYAKCYLEPDRSKAGKRKTSHIRNNCNPNWDQQVQYDNVTLEGLKLRALHVTVWDHDTLSANDFLGVVSLSLGTGRVGGKEVNYMKSKGEEIRIWEEMLAKPNTWIEATIPLKAKL
ncbi:synaptotagmin-like protein 4 isoform X4 [Anneissia japonica]|nr:synaptotagmin-like protein 4 isoform X4 [Anneissia japonica]XP_033100459.1 synaptotagmin-like protein 4 isoform X4 [Anneissia japonica]XP_033100460.1 synaptotagmin-like protein 4 isoform X4 [Anneissia japonica]XP_033100461.1 synaptotagmin-like protein 4 isoform X4 [Anneissia japonica]XP_033100462.1 synaptotagmin-like protein 4 isoform X4 [Anneissia japonica]